MASSKAMGLGGISFDLDLEDVQRMYKWFSSLDSVARNPDAMVNPMRAVSRVIYKNFTDEGALTGRKWQKLSPYTQRIRKERGFVGAGPLLQQSSQKGNGLLQMLGAMNRWEHRAAIHADDAGRGYENDGTTTLIATLGSLSAQATISGPKAGHNRENRSGTFAKGLMLSSLSSSRAGAGYIPARPFFYMSSLGTELAAAEFASRVLLDWRSRDINNTHITGVNIPKVNF